jgi:hypothetical protein
MSRKLLASRVLLGGLILLLTAALPRVHADEPDTPRPGDGASSSSSASDEKAEEPPARQLFRGKVVLLADALKRRDIQAAKELDDHVVLETPEGELIPILADWRGRAFYQDERLRDRKVELVGFRREGIPYLQILMVFTFDENDRRQYTDYWCDICSIPMYEIKPCECCQGETRLRFQERELPEYLEAPSPAGTVRSPETSASSAPSDE